MTAVKITVLVLFVVASMLQLIGAGLVIRDVLTSRANMRAFNDGLDEADDLARQHGARADHAPPGWGEATRLAVWQIGPAPARQREALVTWVRAQNDVGDLRRWTAVGLLLGGLVIDTTANVMSLYI